MSLTQNRVVLIGWDAADWKIIHPLLDAGSMPNLRKLVERGAMGNIATLDPPMSPLLWTSIATGKTADLHGIHGFAEPDPVTGGIRPSTSTSRKVKALWNILSQSGRRSLVVNWFASHPAEPIEGAVVSNAFAFSGGSQTQLPAGAIHPASLAAELAELRVHPGDLTGDDLLPFLPRLAEIDQKTDRRPMMLAKILAENISVQAAATWLMERELWDFLTVFFDLPDHASHAFMPYHPPRMAHVSEKDFELYRDVVNGAYCFADAMLGRMVDLAGPDATFMVVSDHGFQSDHRRGAASIGVAHEAPMEWHRSHGIVCVAGPGIRRDELVYGATLLDIAPTVLALFGLPAGQDMQGRVLAEALERPEFPERIPSWEDVAGESGMHAAETSADAWDSSALMEQMVALGYLEAPAPEVKDRLRQVRAHQAFSLARVYLGQGNAAAALPLMEEVANEFPAEITYQVYLAQCCYATGRMDECRRIVRGVLDRGGDRPAARVLEANLFLAEGRIEEGLAGLLAAEQSEKPVQGVRYAIGRVYLGQKRWADAERAFRSLIAWDEDSPRAHAGLAQALLEQGKFAEAAEAAADAVGLRFDLAEAHFTLGVALARMGEDERAARAFETCLRVRPDSAAAREWLARLTARATGRR